MRRQIDTFPRKAVIALGVIALVLAGCGKAEEVYQSAALPNISLDRTPSTTDAGRVDPKRKNVEVRAGDSAIVAAFRASGCGKPAPDFEKMMRDQVGGGLRVPDGVTLYDAGIGRYTSKKCGKGTKARAIGVYGGKPGTYVLTFFEGKTVRTVTVK
jgi:hypothetical protein